MSRPARLFAAGAAATALGAVLGRMCEQSFLPGFAALLLLLVCAGHSGWRMTFLVLHGGPLAERLLLAAGAGTASVVALMLAAGCAGAMMPEVVLPVQAAMWGCVLLFTRGPRPDVSWKAAAAAFELRRGARVAGAALYVALAVMTYMIVAGLYFPDYDYDTLTNHLFAPAQWLASGAIHIVPAYFGACTAAYEPMHMELVYAWLMLPFHSDLVARFGQVFFLGVAYLAVYALGRRLGLGRNVASAAVLCLHLSAPLVAQAAGAMVDLALAACFVSTIVFLMRYRDVPSNGELAASGIFFGLFLGTKFVSLAYLPVLFLLGLFCLRGSGARLPRLLALWCGIGLGLGSFWYMRNWIIAGNPLYPLRVMLGGLTVFPGAFGPEAMTSWVFNLRTPGNTWTRLPGLLSAALGRASLGGPLAGLTAPLLLTVGAVVCAVLHMGREYAQRVIALVAAVIALILTYWFVLPSHAVRFLFPALILCALFPAVLMGALPGGAVLVPLLLSVHVGVCFAFYISAVPPPWVYALAAVPAGIVIAGRCLPGRPGRFPAAGCVAAVLLVAVLLFKGAHDRPLAAREHAYAQWKGLGAAWRWMNSSLRGTRIAYAGNNVPYLLLGPGFENRVFYVATDRHRGWNFHDYEKHYRGRMPDPLTPEPAFFRMVLDERAWLANLQAAGARYLFVSALFRNELVNFRHSRRGFVVEDRWARNQRDIFSLRFVNNAARIYEIDPAAPPQPFTRPVRRDEIDAVDLYRRDPVRAERLYPGAKFVLQQAAGPGGG